MSTAIRSNPPLRPSNSVWAGAIYQNEVKELIGLLKFSRAKQSAFTLATLLDAVLPLISQNTVIVPAPTANKRIRHRGYDQAQLIAHALARKRQLRYKNVLIRRTGTRQVGATKTQRADQMMNAFLVKYPVNGLDILLIDDVMTTGATLSAAAQLLNNNGARSVSAAVCAYKP